MKLKIITVPDPILRQKSKTIDLSARGKKFQKLAESMIQAVKDWSHNESTGVGLSAVQIGKPFRIFTILNPKNNQYQIFVNPQIIKRSKKLTNDPPEEKARLEGCISIPGIYGVVKRHLWIKLRYQTLDGGKRVERFSDFAATVVQHEYDHLEGILFTDRILAQKGKIYKVEKGKKEKDFLKEVELI